MAVSGLEPRAGVSSEILNGVEDLGKDKYINSDNAGFAARRWLDEQQHHGNPEQADDVHPLFAFEPQLEFIPTSTSQYPSLPELHSPPGWNTVAHQMPSPPNSAASPPSSWPPFGYQQQQPVHNILTDIYPDTKVQYGQSTPPDDDFNNVFTSTEQPQPIPGANANDRSQSASEKKRKRNSASTSSKGSPPKRSRKYVRSADSSNGQDPSGVQEIRRSKFLERNRIAASKCRQKKKEWTHNLENRARELAKENQSLRMMLDSLRDEMLFLKTEMLKHTTCGCEEIQGWAKSGAGSLATSPVIKAEHSPINSAPTSRRGSFSSRGGSENHNDEPTAPHHQASQPPKSPEMQKLEGLLINQLARDTSDQGMANILQAAK
ncbi:MAG: hypothetical protein Q9216_001350 [Gyalolechia sp. 2 TL-2023]